MAEHFTGLPGPRLCHILHGAPGKQVLTRAPLFVGDAKGLLLGH